MSAPHPAPTTSLWTGAELVARDDCDVVPARIVVADSWLHLDGRVRALDLHRSRFLAGIPAATAEELDAEAFWEAAIAAVPSEGAWFPRVELREQRGAPQLLLRIRTAPPRGRSVVLATHRGRDPRTVQSTKGPDLEAMLRLRTEAQAHGADESVILDPEGRVVEGATTSILWWRGSTLCHVAPGLARVESVTERSILALATAMGIAVSAEHAAPADLDGLEIWAVNALHGARIVTGWRGEPVQPAEDPGRLARWELRLDALRRPIRQTGGTAAPAPEHTP